MTEHTDTTDAARYYTVGQDGKINGGGTDSRAQAEEWLEENDDVADLVVAKSRGEAQRKYTQ